MVRRQQSVAGRRLSHLSGPESGREEPDDAQALLEHPSVPLPGYYVAEITITGDSPSAGRKLGDVSWPPASIPVSVLRASSLRPADLGITLAAGDRVSLLVPAGRE